MSRRRVAAGAAALGLASLWWVGAPTPAQACTPPSVQPTEDERMATAPIVIVGRATAVATRPAPTSTSATEGPAPSEYVYEFDIEYIHKGEDLVDDPAIVVTAVDSSECGFQLELGQLYKLFPSREDATHELTIAAFGGNRVASDADLHPYVPGTATTAPPATEPPRSGLIIPVQTIPQPKDAAPTTTPPSTEEDPLPPPPTSAEVPSTTAGSDDEQAGVVVDDDADGGDGDSWAGPVAVGVGSLAAIGLAGVVGYRRRAVPGAP